MTTTLVFGAQPSSLGAAVAKCIERYGYGEVVTAGLGGAPSGDFRHVPLDINSGNADDRLLDMMDEYQVRHVVCTLGMNRPTEAQELDLLSVIDHLSINVVGVLRVLEAWLAHDAGADQMPAHFAAISSNSAHIARRHSLSYCTSKAALSMAIRCAAREWGGKTRSIYCYEPGLLNTGLTKQVALDLPVGAPMHRIPNLESRFGFSPESLAIIIARNLFSGGSMLLNGACVRLDGGEQ